MRVILIRSTEVMPDPPVEKMAAALLDAGHEVKILAWDRAHSYCEKTSSKSLSARKAELIHFGIPAKYSGGIKSNLKAMIRFQWRIVCWLICHRKEYDAIHAFDFDTAFAALPCAKVMRKKLVYHILDYYVDGHSIQGQKLGALIRFCETQAINHADAVILCTEKRTEQIGTAVPRKLTIIHNTPDCGQQIDESFALKGSCAKTKVVYVGVLARERLLKETIEAIGQMDDVEMHIGGFGEYETWIQEASERYDNIFYYGRLQYSETLSLEKQCDVMMAVYDPSVRNHRYAAPNKFYEALMLGKPLIMARGTGCSEAIEKYDFGALTTYSQVDIASVINQLNNRKSDWSAMGERARCLYERCYSWKLMEQRIRTLYTDLMNDRNEEMRKR